ncbi:hypothetical protein [Erwinia amylovora]|uniref:hypothetical protein n=1 Tax=Erwinia amylovora TaxID=552 RepID=UPI003D02ACEB
MQSFIFDQKSPPERTRQRMQADQMQLATNMPTDVSGGVMAVAQALMNRNAQNGATFPTAPAAPAGAPPMSLGSTLMNKLGMNRGGGLF